MTAGPVSAELNIADVRFRVTSTLPVDCAPSHGPYASFHGPGQVNGQTLEVDIQMQSGVVPSGSGLQQIFADHSWALYRGMASYHLEFRSSLPDRPLWTACFEDDTREVTIYGSPQMVQETERGSRMLNPLCYPLDQILWVYAMARRGGLLLHAAGAILNGRAFVFPGPGGAGKTTLSRLLDGQGGFEILSDDRIAVRCLDDGYHAYGTPWPGDARKAQNRSAPLRAVMFLVQAPSNEVRLLKPREALRKLIPVVSLPWYNREVIEPMLRTCEDLVSTVPACDLCFAPDTDLVDLLQRYALSL